MIVRERVNFYLGNMTGDFDCDVIVFFGKHIRPVVSVFNPQGARLDCFACARNDYDLV